MPRLGMVIDLGKCMGSRACQEACKIENNTGQGVFWMHVFRFERGEYPNARVQFLPRPCQHCDNAPCIKVCPVGARYKEESGPVLTDYDRCIGCRYCEVACPYGVIAFNWKHPEENYYLDWHDKDLEPVTHGNIPPYKNPDLDLKHGTPKRLNAGGGHFKGVTEKCTFCVQRRGKGLPPACVANCPVFALQFGDLDDPKSNVSKTLAENPYFRLLEDRGTKPSVYYVNGEPPDPETKQIEPVAKGP